MNTARTSALRRRWAQLRGIARMRWTRLSDADLTAIDGRAERLSSLLQDHYGLERVEAREQVNEWLRTVIPHPSTLAPKGEDFTTRHDAGADPAHA